MNSKWKYKLKELFTFSKGERLGIVVLLLVVLAVLLYPLLGTLKKGSSLLTFDEFKQQVDDFELSAKRTANNVNPTGTVVKHAFADSKKRRTATLEPLRSIELNSADTVLLTRLKGIGPHYAKEIVLYRKRLGGFYKPEQLMEVKGIGKVRFSRITTSLKTNEQLITPLAINTAGEERLAQHPYIGERLSKAIVTFRSVNTITSLSQLVGERILTESQADRLRPYLSFE